MKIAYILPIDVAKYDGVLNKVTSQVEAWEKLGNEVIVYLITQHSDFDLQKSSLAPLVAKNVVEFYKVRKLGFFPIELCRDWFGLQNIYTVVLNNVEKFAPDVVYTRSTLYQPFLKNLGKKFKLVLEVNTDMGSEYRLQATQSLKYFFRYIYFLTTNRHLLKKVSGLASVTYDISNSFDKIPKGVFPNSINIYNYNINILKNKIKHSIFFIGSPGMPWHGVDILIELAEQLNEVDFDIVGVEESDFPYAPKNVKLHGYLNKREYLGLIEKASATIASLAFYRNNMNEACPLKVREYLACSKPVILPYRDTAFEQKGYPDWVLKLPNSREGILASTDAIKTFLNECNSFKITKEEVKKYVHVDYIEKDRLAFFKSITGSI